MNQRIEYKWIILLLLLIPIISGCNNADDVQKIFTGKTWKMTYITKKKDYGWYKFKDVNENIYQSYDPLNGTRAFKITFTGSTTDNIISGDFSSSGSVIMSGTWTANGETNAFSTSVKKSSVTDSKDTLGKYIAEGIKKATTYEGDEKNLYLYFEYEKETLCIAFKPDI